MEEQELNKKKPKKGVMSFINGMILADARVSKQIPFILFLVFLGIVLITNRNVSEKNMRKIELLRDSIKELKSESVTVSAKLMQISRPSEVVDRVKKAELGLVEPENPPQKLTIEKAQ